MEESDRTVSKTSESLNDEMLSDIMKHTIRAPISTGRMLVGNVLRTWAEVSKLNYLEEISLKSRQSTVKLRSFAIACKESSLFPTLGSNDIFKKTEEIITEAFPHNVTSLMNEGQLWGCFYNFPELYEDMYSPTIRILKLPDVAELIEGVLTRDMVAACLTYLHRTPILGDYVYIKLNLSGKQLRNIDVLQHYKYLVYLDLSSNLLKDLNVLSHLLYLQFLSVDFNRLETVLEYSTPQWFLTEVHYKYNAVKTIRDLAMFWSITILDLSHNNIKCISGLETLRYLRHLDLSFNHIQRLENLNHLRLLWLDVSYNNISSFELGPNTGLWTLLHLDHLNLDENNLKSMKIFSGCTRLRELYVRNNRFSSLLELAVYMRQLRRLIVLDLRANPICTAAGYTDVVFDTFPLLLNLDASEIDPIYQGHYIQISRKKFDDMLLAGEFLTYSEMDGESYGLSREEAFISEGKVRVCSMDLIGALMLKLRGRRPYLILTACHDINALAARQFERKQVRISEYEKQMSTHAMPQASTLQVLVSGRIIINGILNEIIMSLPEDKIRSEFALDSECSLFMESDVREATRNQVRGADLLALLTVTSSDTSLAGRRKASQADVSLYSIYQQSQDSSAAVTASAQDTSSFEDQRNGVSNKEESSKPTQERTNCPNTGLGSKLRFEGTNNQQENSRTISEERGSKSVTFTAPGVSGMVIDAPITENLKSEPETRGHSVSSKLPCLKDYDSSHEDPDLWLAFLTEAGLIQASETGQVKPSSRRETNIDSPESILRQLNYYNKTPAAAVTSTLRDDYEDIHRLCPGLFHDTIAMDDPKEAFQKAKRIIRDIINSQNGLAPMFDIDFANNLHCYPTVEQKLEDIRKEIAPRQIFY